jgi:DNA-binding MurR/RpiR family transcriptional regulator
MDLRLQLTRLGQERGDRLEAGHELDQRMGDLLLEVRQATGLRLTMQESSDLLGVSRPTAYRFLKEAMKRAER